MFSLKQCLPALFAAVILGAGGVHAQVVPFGFFRKVSQSDRLTFTTSAQSIYTQNCSGVTTVQAQTYLGAAINVGSNLTVNLTAVSGVTYFSDSNCTSAITSVTIGTGTSSSSFYFLSTSAGTKSLGATATAYANGSQNQTLTASPFLWTGGGGNVNWSTAGNWSGGAAPSTTSDVAIFDGSCSSNCSPTVNASISIGGVRINSNYSGTITQGTGFTITLSSPGWIQQAGTFAGGNSTVSLSGPFLLSGGTYTATSGSTSILRDFLVSGSPTFNHSSGSFSITGANSGTYSLVPGSVVFNNVSFGGNSVIHNLTGTMTVDGNLTLADVNAGKLNSGTIDVKGNLTISSNGVTGTTLIRVCGSSGQTVTGSSGGLPALEIAATGGSTVIFSGNIAPTRNFTWTSGLLTAGSSTLTLSGQASTNTTITPSTVAYNNVTFTGNVTTHTLVGTMTVGGTLTISDINGAGGSLDTGTIEAKGDVTIANFGKRGTGNLKIIGNGAMSTVTLTGTSNAATPNLEINTAGTLNVSGSVNIAKAFVYTAGTINAGTSTFIFTLSGQTITHNSFPFYSVYFNTNAGTQSFTGTMTVLGNLTVHGQNVSNSVLNTGTFDVAGDFTCVGSGYGGTAAVNFTGAVSKTMTVPASCKTLGGLMTLNKSGGASMTLANATSLTANQDLTITAGTFDMAGYNFTVNHNISNSGTLKRGNSPSCGTLTYTGSYTGSAAVCP